MQRKFSFQKRGYYRNQEQKSHLEDVSNILQQINSSSLEDHEKKIDLIIQHLTSQTYPIRKQATINIVHLFERICLLLIKETNEKAEMWMDSFISCCKKQSILFSEATISICIETFSNHITNLGIVRFLSYAMETNGKQCSSDCIQHLLSILLKEINSLTLSDEQLYSYLLCYSSICHISSIVPILQQLPSTSLFHDSFSILLQQTQSLPSSPIQMKNHSLCLHILTFLIQHDFTIPIPNENSSLLPLLTSTYLPSSQPSIELAKYIANYLQFLRVAGFPTQSELDSIIFLSSLLQWIFEWKGDSTVIHECLSFLRVVIKTLDEDWLSIHEPFTQSFLHFLQWSFSVLKNETPGINQTEVIRTLQVCVKYSSLSIQPTIINQYCELYLFLLSTILTYKPPSSIPIQDYSILLTQFLSFNQYHQSFTWLTSLIHSFPWQAFSQQVFSPFLPPQLQKVFSQCLSHLLQTFGDCFDSHEKDKIIQVLKVSSSSSLSVNECISLAICMEGLLSPSFQDYQESFYQTISTFLNHPSSSVKERILQTLYSLDPSSLLPYSSLLLDSLEKECLSTSFHYSILLDWKLRILTKMNCSCSSSLLLSLSSQLFPLLPSLSNHFILHILQFFITYADSLQVSSSIVNLAGFFFSSEQILLQHYFQLLTSVTRILQIDEILQILQILHQNQEIDSSLSFPFFFSILRFHSQDSFSEESECIFTNLLIKSCKEGINIKKIIQFFHSLEEPPLLIEHSINQVIQLIEEFYGSKKNQLSYVETVIIEEVLRKCRLWVL